MIQIPDDKRYFRIGEASRIIGVEPYVLRYWESEFPQVKPRRADSKQRTYQRKDLETLLRIKKMLYEDGMTISGAKQRLKKEEAMDKPFIEKLAAELQEIIRILT